MIPFPLCTNRPQSLPFSAGNPWERIRWFLSKHQSQIIVNVLTSNIDTLLNSRWSLLIMLSLSPSHWEAALMISMIGDDVRLTASFDEGSVNHIESTLSWKSIIIHYSTSARWIWVGYNHLTSNKHEWNNCFIKNAQKISWILPDFIGKNNRF